MKRNMSTADRSIRLVIAALIIILYLTNVIAGTLGIVLLVIAGILMLTSFVGYCPLYSLLGIHTHSERRVQ